MKYKVIKKGGACTAVGIFLLIFGVSSCQTVPAAVVVQDPGWKAAVLPEVLPTRTGLMGSSVVFILPAKEGWTRAEVVSPRFSLPLPLERREGVFAAAVTWDEGQDLEYAFAVGEGAGKRILDPVNREVRWTRPTWSLVRGNDSAPAVLLFEEKELVVLLPEGYGQNPDRRYPVMYWLDGQNMPDGRRSPWGGWKADTIAASLVEAGEMQEIIQVGIFSHSSRMTDYTGWTGPLPDGISVSEAQKQASLALTARITEEVKPWTDSTFRTLPDRKNTGMGGSSAGAMMALYLAWSQPEVYSKVAALAGGAAPYRYLRENLFRPGLDQKIYLDCGTEGVDVQLLPGSREMGEFLLSQGFVQGKDLEYKIFQGDPHNEAAWAGRLPGVFKFLFPAGEKK